MTQAIAAIPTVYAGVQFRSRLEAKWAAFFDLCGLEWDYEPFDCNGYIPDFLICKRVLAEIKPIVWGERSDAGMVADARLKLETAFPAKRFYWIALLGSGIHCHGYQPNGSAAMIGEVATEQLRERGGEETYWHWTSFALDWWSDGAFGPAHVALEAQPILKGSDFRDPPNLELLWREAGNRVQWKSPTKPSRQRKSRNSHVVDRHFNSFQDLPAPPGPRVPDEEIRSFFASLGSDDIAEPDRAMPRASNPRDYECTCRSISGPCWYHPENVAP